MSKYDPLSRFLAKLTCDSKSMKFSEIDALVSGGLPQSAYDYRPWWANRYDGNDAQNKGWQSVGWESGDVDMKKEHVTFYRKIKHLADFEPASAKVPAGALSIEDAKKGLALKFGVTPDQIDINIRG
jgi:hypothetical protein